LKDPEGRKFKVASSEVETSPIIEDAQPKKRSRRELTKSERTSMLYLIRDQRLIKSIRKNEDISDEELLDLHTKALEAKRYQDMMRALRSYQKDN
jgi:hypothetical protein